MSRRAKRGFGFGAMLLVLVAVGGWMLWQPAGSPAPVEAQEPGPAEERLAVYESRFGDVLNDATLQPAGFQSLADDLRANLAGSAFSGGEKLRARQLLIAVLRQLGDRAGATAELGFYLDDLQVHRGPETTRQVCRRQGDDRLAHRDFDAAIDCYTLLQQRWPNEPEACYAAYHLALCLERKGDQASALAAYQNCIQSFPEGEWTGEAHLRAASMARQLQDFETAESLYADLKTARPGTRYPVEAQRDLAEMLKFQDRNDEAIAAYNVLKGMVPHASTKADLDKIIADVSDRLLESH